MKADKGDLLLLHSKDILKDILTIVDHEDVNDENNGNFDFEESIHTASPSELNEVYYIVEVKAVYRPEAHFEKQE